MIPISTCSTCGAPLEPFALCATCCPPKNCPVPSYEDDEFIVGEAESRDPVREAHVQGIVDRFLARMDDPDDDFSDVVLGPPACNLGEECESCQ